MVTVDMIARYRYKYGASATSSSADEKLLVGLAGREGGMQGARPS